MTAAKMILHDWQRGKIPFFVPPPRQEGGWSEEPNVFGANKDEVVGSSQASAAFKAIANVISAQQQKSVPVQRDLFTENELRGDKDTVEEGETSKPISDAEGDTDSETSEQISDAEGDTDTDGETSEQISDAEGDTDTDKPAEGETASQLPASES